jgi:hypothetical protein
MLSSSLVTKMPDDWNRPCWRRIGGRDRSRAFFLKTRKQCRM